MPQLTGVVNCQKNRIRKILFTTKTLKRTKRTRRSATGCITRSKKRRARRDEGSESYNPSVSELVANPFPIVGVGASAGGLEPLTQLLSALPCRPGLAVVIIQHLDPHYTSQLSSILQQDTS